MKLFHCSCGTNSNLFFESRICTVCGKMCGYSQELSAVVAFTALDSQGQNAAVAQQYTCAEDPGVFYKKCANYQNFDACNGMLRLPQQDGSNINDALCFCCSFNALIPDTSIPENLTLWQRMENAKRRTIYTLKALDLPLQNRAQAPDDGIAFRFLSDSTPQDHFRTALPEAKPVMTGHNRGIVTINIAEADDVARKRAQATMGEDYRTLLGHFRHELGHYYWDILVHSNSALLNSFREIFGDEQADYQQALDRHYKSGPPDNWHLNFVSAYATMHPWEDWAETWAHYLHMIDTLETAQSFGVQVDKTRDPNSTAVGDLSLPQTVDVYNRATPVDTIMKTWMRLSVMLNSLNRSMGVEDAYPFVLNTPIQNKIKFIHDVIEQA